MNDKTTELVTGAIDTALTAEKLVGALSLLKKAAITATLVYVAVTAVKVFKN